MVPKDVKRALKKAGFKRSGLFGVYYYGYPPTVEAVVTTTHDLPYRHREDGVECRIYYHGQENKDLAKGLASVVSLLVDIVIKVLPSPPNKAGSRIPGSHKRVYSVGNLECPMILYKGQRYKEADVPPNMEPTTPSDPKGLVTDDPNEDRTEITEIERPPEVKPYNPKVEVLISKLEKRLEALQKFKLPFKLMKKLIPQYHLPAAQILISDFAASKKRALQQMEDVLEELRKVAP